MAWWDGMLRRARMRGLQEGMVQRVRVESLEHDVRDDVERFQDYGFAANPVEGQGIKLEIGGHTVVIRMDRLAERPQLPAYEVAIWHKEGHMVRLRAGRLVQVDCDRLVINASASVAINSPSVALSGVLTAPTVAAADSLTVAGKEIKLHTHTGVTAGLGTSGPQA